jgi:hypothetical protein
MRTIVIYPGRFQPGHKGHKSSYDYLANKFGAENVYVATSDVTAPVTNPFSFADKVQMLTKLGIPSSHIVQVRNPYQAQEITKDIPDPDNTALVFAVSEKDMGETPRFKFGVKKNGEPSYMQPYPKDGKVKPLTKHAYVMVTPTTTFKVRGVDASSATAIRNMYSTGNAADHKQIIHDLYGVEDSALQDLFDKKLGIAQKTKDVVLQQPPLDANVLDTPAPLQRESKTRKEKLTKLLESTMIAERKAAHCYRPFDEDLLPNYISERDKSKYY